MLYLDERKHFATWETCKVMFTLSAFSGNSSYKETLHCDHVRDELQFFSFPSLTHFSPMSHFCTP